MAYEFDTVDVWAGSMVDRPGGLAEKLTALSDAGVNLDFVIARRDTPGKGVVFCAPVSGTKGVKAAQAAGLQKAAPLKSLRVTGPDSPGLGSRMAEALAEAGINVRGVSGAALGKKAIFYIGFDDSKDIGKARQILKRTLR